MKKGCPKGQPFFLFFISPNQSIIKCDSKYLIIAAASVLAKIYRDDYMNKIHEEFAMYKWKNKGYPTKEHREAIMKIPRNEFSVTARTAYI